MFQTGAGDAAAAENDLIWAATHSLGLITSVVKVLWLPNSFLFYDLRHFYANI